MPELPEVETIANGLRQGGSDGSPSLIHQAILSACVLWPRSIAEPAPSEFERRIAGQVITAIGRRAKYLVMQLSQDTLLIHLRMSGNLLVEPHNAEIPTHHRLLLFLQGGWRLAFNDTRKFGRAWLTNQPDQVLGRLGPEPLDPAFSAQEFYRRLQASRRQLKPLLLDQEFIAGLGNIYTDEALHLSKLHPLLTADQLDETQAAVLLDNIRRVLSSGIRHHGASIDWVYRNGDFQNYFLVYQRDGQPCRKCGATIQRLVVGQRGTHFCPVCQPTPEGGRPA